MIGRIVETEAYLHTEPASHGYKGKRTSNRVLFGPVGRAYVYFIYGMHYCMNVTTGYDANKGGVLIRALEPIQGMALMAQRRGTQKRTLLCSGPARLAQALGIDRAFDGTPVWEGPLQIWSRESFPSSPAPDHSDIVQTTRIGISKAQELPYRFYLRGNPHVSRK